MAAIKPIGSFTPDAVCCVALRRRALSCVLQTYANVCDMLRYTAAYCGILRHVAAKTTQHVARAALLLTETRRTATHRNASAVNEP